MQEIPNNQHGASWEEIGQALGVTSQRIHQIYNNAIRKIKANPEELAKFRDLVQMKEQLRNP